MKISDFSEEKGLTKQAVYKAINRAGFSTKQITDKNGNITSKGFSVLRSLFPDPEPPPQESGRPQEQPDNQTEKEVERLQERIKELEERCSEWERRYFDAVDAAKKESEQLRVLISQEQQLRLAAERKGLFRRLFAGKKDDEQ